MADTTSLAEDFKAVNEKLNEYSKKSDKIEVIRVNLGDKMHKDALALIFNQHIKWNLPQGTPKFRRADNYDTHGLLKSMITKRKLNLFLAPPFGSASINQLKQESYFVETLETIVPEDATVLLAMKEKKMAKSYDNITKQLVVDSFPKETADW